MLYLIRIFIDIVLIRRGPDAIPKSPMLFAAACLLWLAALIAIIVFEAEYTLTQGFIDLFVAALSVGVFALVVVARHRAGRLLQTVTALIGTSAVISFALMLWILIVPNVEGSPLNLIPLLLLLWAVQVKAHIIARACDYPLMMGVIISLFVFFLRLSVDDFLSEVIA